MDCRAPNRRSSLAGLLLVTALSACSGGRTPPATTASPRTTSSASRGLDIPASEAFDAAVARGTRTTTGAPGPRYWQQWTDYRLAAELNPISKRLTGQGTLTYHNRSPDTLQEVYVQLLHNIFAPGARHNTDVPWSVEGVQLSRVAAQGQELKPSEKEGSGYEVDGTVMRITLPRPLPPGGSAALEFN
ncbi:MAG TPA: hypothetical protein VFY42_00800, partial [Gemmatimonadales bacterium]|nr:hypothetical protein [Gemmatimonadales bacterium]